MKKILVKLSLVALLLICILVLVSYRLSRGMHDMFYNNVASPKASSMIIGTSRASQGVLPHVINREWKGETNHEIINFSFTVAHTPYGPSYLNLIKKKLSDTVKTGEFIVTVDPWAISMLFSDEKDLNSAREIDRFTSKISFVSMQPNFEYIFKYYNGPLYKLFLTTEGTTKLHQNGWLEINVDQDSLNYRKALESKLKDYQKYVAEGRISPMRIYYLKETISFLKQHGDVYLIRIPTSEEMADLERQEFPSFDNWMLEISAALNVPYLNYISESCLYQTTDGNHLQKDSGYKFSMRLANDISQIKNKKIWN